MLTYLVRRIAIIIPTLFFVSIIIFGLQQLLPGDPALAMAGEERDPNVIAFLRHKYHLDEPLPVRYGLWLGGVLHGDLGESLYTNHAVALDLAETFPATFELVLVSALLMTAIGIPLGVLAARGRDGPVDHTLRLAALLGVVTPSFVWAVVFMLIFSATLGWLPIIGRISNELGPPRHWTGLFLVDSLLQGDLPRFVDALAHIALPATALALAGIGQAARLTRANMVETYGRPYIEAARAYGLSEWRIATRFALRPALSPVLTVLGLDIAAKLGNAFLVETVFNWPGMARYGVQAMLRKDLNAIVAVATLMSVLFVAFNIVVDGLVAVIDPKIRIQGRL